MKKLLSIGLLLLIVSISYSAKAQIESISEMTITPPTFQNTKYDNLTDYFEKSLEYPLSSINKLLQGTEVVRFTVSENGAIEDILVLNSVSWEIDGQVIQLLEKTNGNWKPGSIDGQETKMEKEIALIFLLNSYDDMRKIAQNFMVRGNRMIYSKNKPEKALAYFNKAYTLFPYEPDVLEMRLTCLQKMGQTEEAEEFRIRIELLEEQNKIGIRPIDAKLISMLQ